MTLFNLNHKYIYPYETTEVEFWTKKWGIAPDQLNEAILQTGSVRASVVKNYLEKKGILFSVSGVSEKIQARWNWIVSHFQEQKHYL